ncbi:hypothetical protein [Nonomuraea sp. NPDC049725]|uniref:hypothetical protein n=1 Tax=Nonomuraea sp. NPDC049725 TaxID=3154508 RepID=UPI0034443E26
MSSPRNGIAGFRLTEHTWITELGNWIDAISPDGRRAGALLFDARVIEQPGVRERVVSAVLTDRRLVLGGLTGLIPVADVVAAGDQVWLLTAQAVTPTLSTLLTIPPSSDTPGRGGHPYGGAPGRGGHPYGDAPGRGGHPYGDAAPQGGRPFGDSAAHGGHPYGDGGGVSLLGGVEAGGAASVLVETARTLLGLHAAGVTHGSVHPGTVVITAEGEALLSERGLADAIRGQVSAPERDAAGWASLARGLAASSTREAPQVAALFERAAGTAVTRGLAAARDLLLAELPPGTVSRDGLARAARGRSVFAQPPAYRQPAAPAPEDRDEGDIVTLLHVPETRTPAGPDGMAAPDGLAGAGAGTRPGAEVATRPGRQGDGEVRFGPGVGAPAETAAERIWREGRDGPGGRRGAGRRGRARRRRTVLSAVVLAAVLAGAAFAWLRLNGGGGPELAVSEVAVRVPKKTQGCDTVVTVTGTITTNGGVGEIRYEWHQNLEKKVERGTLRTRADRTSYDLTLRWELQGESTVKATSTLRVLSPGPARSGKATFTYKC